MTLNYKCPSCGGSMSFDAEKQVLACNFCGNTIAIDAQMESQVETTTETEKEPEPEYDEYHGYKCPSCGAEIVTDDNTVATFCSFCGNPTLMEDRVKGVRRPSRVIPFKLDKKAAVANFSEWTKKGILTPSEFKRKATINKLQGIYVPFFLYDYDTTVDMDCKATKTRREHHGDDEYVYTDHYLVHRKLFVKYDKLPTDASKKMDDDMMDILEPFDYTKLADYNNGYLSGYYAEKYDLTDEELQSRAEAKAKHFGDKATRDTIRDYDSVETLRTNYHLKRTNTEYVMMPVWLLNYKWNQKLWTLAINGETGKRAGKLPSSPSKIFGYWAGISGGLFALMMLFTFVL